MRQVLVIRPEPGASATAEGARALGLDPILCPLFAFEPVGWTAPDPSRFDALLLTSANALRFGGPGLAALVLLPVLAVGEATAEAARAAGFGVTAVGTGGMEALLESVPGPQKLLHLCGEDRTEAASHHSIEVMPVYRSAPIDHPVLPNVGGLVVAVHSPRAGGRLAELVHDRRQTAIAAISELAATACGTGWQAIEWAAQPTDSALLALAARLCQSRAQ